MCVSRGKYIFVLSAKAICRLTTTFHCTTSEINERARERERKRKKERARKSDREFSGGCSSSCVNEALNGFQTDRELSLHPSFPSTLIIYFLCSVRSFRVTLESALTVSILMKYRSNSGKYCKTG